MVTRDIIKKEIDKVQEDNLTALYNIIKVFELPKGLIINSSEIKPEIGNSTLIEPDWGTFINETYGSLKDDPIKRGPQGEYEIREAI